MEKKRKFTPIDQINAVTCNMYCEGKKMHDNDAGEKVCAVVTSPARIGSGFEQVIPGLHPNEMRECLTPKLLVIELLKDLH